MSNYNYYMFSYMKYFIISLVFLNILLVSKGSLIKNMIVLENIWLCTFCFLNVTSVFTDDTIFNCMSFLSLVIAACEIITLASIYILDYNK